MLLELALKILFVVLIMIVAIRIVKAQQHREKFYFERLHQAMESDLEKLVKDIKKDLRK